MRTALRRPSRYGARRRSVLACAGALAAAMSPAIVHASQSGETATAAETIGAADLPAGWRRTIEQGVETFLKGVEPVEAVVLVKEVPASATAEVDAVTARLFPLMGCKDAQPASRDGSTGPFGDGPRCFASFARSPGGYRIAVGAATAPQAEAEALDVARRLSAAGGAPADASTLSGGVAGAVVSADPDVKTVNAALAAALNAVPERNLPIHMALRRGFRFAGDNIAPTLTMWMLFADGFATSCTKWDPAKLFPTTEALASVVEDTGCKTARWRRVPGGAMFDDETTEHPSSLEDGPPPARGVTYAGEFGSSEVAFSSLMSWGVPGNLLINSSAMSLSRDGRFRLGSERYDRNNLNSTTTTQPTLAGRYLVDRYLIALALNGRVERHFFFALGKPTDEDFLFYFDGKLLGRR